MSFVKYFNRLFFLYFLESSDKKRGRGVPECCVAAGVTKSQNHKITQSQGVGVCDRCDKEIKEFKEFKEIKDGPH